MPDYKPPNKRSRKAPYTCPKCKSDIRLVTTFTGYDVEEIDPVTGDWVEDTHIDVSREDIHNVEWNCSRCNWIEATEEIDE